MPPSITTRLRAGVAVGLGAAALLLGACSHSSTPPIARAEQAGPGTPTAKPSVTTEQEAVQKYVASVRAYAVCARAAGVDMPDPDATGTLNPPPGLKQKVMQDPAKKAQLDACAKKLVNVPASLQYPDLTPAQFAKAKKFAVCMRAHGVPSYPDPSIHTAPGQATGPDLSVISTPAYQKGMNTCTVSVYGHEAQG
jgi:hypothetical protein